MAFICFTLFNYKWNRIYIKRNDGNKVKQIKAKTIFLYSAISPNELSINIPKYESNKERSMPFRFSFKLKSRLVSTLRSAAKQRCTLPKQKNCFAIFWILSFIWSITGLHYLQVYLSLRCFLDDWVTISGQNLFPTNWRIKFFSNFYFAVAHAYMSKWKESFKVKLLYKFQIKQKMQKKY